MDTKCSRCHNIERVFASRRTRQEWRALVTRMSNRHRSWISDTEANLIGDYLIDVYGVRKEAEIRKVALVRTESNQKSTLDPCPRNWDVCFAMARKAMVKPPDTPDWTSAKWQDGRSDEDLIRSIADGKGQMPKFQDKLTPDEITAAVKFIRTFRDKN